MHELDCITNYYCCFFLPFPKGESKEVGLCEVLGCCNGAAEISSLLRYGIMLLDDLCPVFQDSIVVSSLGV
jgi:hypothetical protein